MPSLARDFLVLLCLTRLVAFVAEISVVAFVALAFWLSFRAHNRVH